MKKLVFISIIVLGVLTSGFTQEAVPASNSPVKREAREDMLLMNFNWTSLLNTGDTVTVKPYSWGYDLKLMYDVPIQNSNFSFALGGGLGIANYYTNSEIKHYNLETDSSQSFFIPIANSRNVKGNKLTITYADIPFELRYRSDPDKHGYSWKIAVGFKVGYHLQTKTKIKETVMVQDGYTITGENSPEDDQDVDPVNKEVKSKSYYYPNYEKWRYGLNVRVAYGRVGLNAFYSATSIFDEDKGARVNPISIGITLMPF
ncbi:MAG: outer membrane beta-barrel protein [Flavobacteriales bacterium]|nr:outer membrane beta-barrel protein [Flavobacteriales bacterium]